ncbi:MAG TPA: zf-TFIIB domain-containing protein [Candidatus Saccharimonadales bacterium]|nr:zf-TFIIB domain-containing protein [Candidatus Saccharimonadales bacterium]
MNCPTDGTPLVMSDRQGIEIDYCPKCRGVWLDRGELDKVIERSQQAMPPAPAESRNYPRDDHNRGYRGEDGYHKRRKESWLSELFD